ncbi:PIN domain-containing protein [Natronorubrum daqingense]|uniref:PIN domain-containing protein n=1 Tax=Natronorubrum daqingense TaxID=588898 RepID=A0A1N7FYG6_9EURY|nr:hypothetical protein [Natronorubrum daqingense]SIS05390.1 hypothetical protein SAMN05421809_3580 [Natronorubrum daqingense]
MSGCVFDTEAIIAYLYDEPGRSFVERYLRDVRDGAAEGLLAETNAGEVLYRVARFEGIDDKPTTGSLRTADRDISVAEAHGVSPAHNTDADGLYLNESTRRQVRGAYEQPTEDGTTYFPSYLVVLYREPND